MANLTDFHRTFPLPDGTTARIVSLPAVVCAHPRVARFPPSIRILLEAALRRADGTHAATEHARALLDWRAGDGRDIPVWVSRVLLQDASGIPLLCDLAAMRSAAVRAGVHAQAVQPTLPVDLVVDHSVVVDAYGEAAAHDTNLAAEYRLNAERFQFVKWAARAFQGVRVIPPGNGIVHQINLEFLAGVVARRDGWLFPDTVVGTDSHTTMINALGVLGWGVGGLEAEIALLGEPLHQSAPEVVAVHLTGTPGGRVLATDVALHLTHALREAGVVGKFLEFVGPGARHLSLPDRATIANMAPEYGATTAFFGIDDTTLAYLAQTGRSRDAIETIRAYYAAQGLFGIPDAADYDYTSVLSIDLSAVEPTLAGPARPHQKLAVAQLSASVANGGAARSGSPDGLDDGAVVLAAITSCTNTANPAAMLAAGLLAQRAAARGLRPPGHVKTVLAPGSRAVTRYLERAGLLEPLQRLGFFVAAYGCASCVGNTGALADGVEAAVRARGLSVAAVLSGNRNFEGRITARSRPTISRAPRSSWPTRWPARSRAISIRRRSGSMRPVRRSSSLTCGPTRQKSTRSSMRWSTSARTPACMTTQETKAATAPAGRASMRLRRRCSNGARRRATSSNRRSSMRRHATRERSGPCVARVCSPCLATLSRPTISARSARSRPTARRPATCARGRFPTTRSIPMARAAATIT